MKTDRLLLDTCAVLWTALDAGIAGKAEEAMNASVQADVDVMVSPITAWELGLLEARGRLPTAQQASRLFNEFLSRPGIGLEGLSPEILIDSSSLPGELHNDPADRIIIATARALDMIVVTRDRAILRYAQQGYVRALEC